MPKQPGGGRLALLLVELPGIEHALDELLDNTPLGRTGTTDDIADAAFFLCAPDSWITGTNLQIDGGAHTRRYPDLLGRIQALAQSG